MKTVADWLAWGALFLPLVVVAWSACQYVILQKHEAAQRKFINFFATLDRVHNRDRSLICQKAAIFELRNYPEYRDFILRLCDQSTSLFPATDSRIVEEFDFTAQFLRDRR